MFPVLIVQCGQPGLLYINGAFCGELNEPQMLPVRPDGRVYIEYRALEGPAFPLAASVDLRGGQLSGALPASVYAVQWPDRVIEMELRPSLLPRASAPRETLAPIALGHASLYHQRQGGEEAVCAGDVPLFAVPSGTRNLRVQALAGGALLIGEQEGGASAWFLDTSDPDEPTLIDQVHAQQLSLEGEDTLRALTYAGDLVGHAHLSVYRLQQGRFARQSREHAWMPDAPRWPQTERDTLRAYVEALLVGAQAEAQAYLTPAAKAQISANPTFITPADPTQRANYATSTDPAQRANSATSTDPTQRTSSATNADLAQRIASVTPSPALPPFQAVVDLPRPLIAPPPGHPHMIGLLEASSPNLGVVRALCANLIPAQHAQGRFLIDSLQLLET